LPEWARIALEACDSERRLLRHAFPGQDRFATFRPMVRRFPHTSPAARRRAEKRRAARKAR
jgi:hypothetical protein